MTRFELLQLLIGQAKTNGFEFRRWYTGRLGLPWTDSRAAVENLAAERRYYALLFSHEFAQNFWKGGAKMTFLVPTNTFQRTRPDGSIGVNTIWFSVLRMRISVCAGNRRSRCCAKATPAKPPPTITMRWDVCAIIAYTTLAPRACASASPRRF